MDIIIQREALLKPLQAVSGVVEKKTNATDFVECFISD